MGQIKQNREQVARIIGAQLANALTDDQLPAILHAIDGDEFEVRLAAQEVTRSPDANNPGALLLWKLRERKRTNLIPVPEPQPRTIQLPPLPDAAELERRADMARDWTRIQRAVMRSQEIKDLWHAMYDHNNPPSDADAAIMRAELIEVLDAENARRQEARA